MQYIFSLALIFIVPFFLYRFLISFFDRHIFDRKWLLKLRAKRKAYGPPLIGGIILIPISTFSLSMLTLSDLAKDLFEPQDISIINVWCFLSFSVFLYGILDDFKELRTRTKLFLQLFVTTLFSIYYTKTLLAPITFEKVLLVQALSFAVINGSNLLDGLDGLLTKISFGLLATYVLFAQILHIPTVLFIAPIFFAPLIAFYFYNRHPAKIYLGETGAVFLGTTFILLTTLLQTKILSQTNTYSYIPLIPLSIPIFEISISFFRRLINKRSPFSRDRLHLHNILIDMHSYGVNQTTNYLTFVSIFSVFVGMMISLAIKEEIGICATFTIMAIYSIYTARNSWFTFSFKPSLIKNQISNESQQIKNEKSIIGEDEASA